MADASYHFLSFVRRGFAGALTQPDTFGSAQPALSTSQVSVAVAGVAQPVARSVAVRGPGDVTGVSSTQVVRTDIPQPMLGKFVELATKAREFDIADVELAPPLIAVDEADFNYVHQIVADALVIPTEAPD
jgi:hypothetical protein